MSIDDSTDFLDSKWSKIPKRQRQWHIDNNYFSFVMCENCRIVPVNWSIKNKQYSRFCSSKCAHSHDSVKKKTQDTCLKRYGAVSNLSTEYNKQKQRETCLKKYGVENYAKSAKFKQKYKETCIEKYGVDNVSKSSLIKEKINKSHQEKYNRKRASQSHLSSEIINKKNDREYMLYLYKDLKMPLTEIAKQLKVNHSQLCVHFKNNLDIDISRHNVSWPETEIYQFVRQFADDAVQSDRSIISPKELDIVIPSRKIAIEYNGLAWHGEANGKKDKHYHLNKTNLANQKGYRLIHIFSNEWETQKDLVKSRLKNLLGKSQKIAARKCKIQSVDKKTAQQFLTANHIQGSCFHKTAYGLYYDNELVNLMTFGRSRFNKNYDQELLRYANKQGFTIQGGASKLFKHFLKNHSTTSVISYCDLRWNTGKLYENLGFEFIKNTDPNYWYVVNNKFLENRVKYQKHKLPDILESFDSNLTEWENMITNGYDRVWDCGNGVWVYKP